MAVLYSNYKNIKGSSNIGQSSYSYSHTNYIIDLFYLRRSNGCIVLLNNYPLYGNKFIIRY